ASSLLAGPLAPLSSPPSSPPSPPRRCLPGASWNVHRISNPIGLSPYEISISIENEEIIKR
ncbi:MAG: hypothetical protein QF411_03805, partial [Planctomycetota bacterium]|nr:hypothetical protein [Planctomycetota bacterium]